jgi:hypothetical protein
MREAHLHDIYYKHSMIQRCKHDMKHMEMQHAYVHQPSQPKLKKEKQLQALVVNEQM